MKRKGRASAWLLLAVAAICFFVYGPTLPRDFVSEDFPTLRLLSQGPPGERISDQLTGPWLGVTFMRLYRPVAGFLLQLEFLAWRDHPLGYGLAHLLLHLVNVVLLYRLSRDLIPDAETPARLAAFLFAVYPLHPNTVVFVASYATLFSATASLGAVLFFLRHRRTGKRLDLGLGVTSFALALGCYEASAVLPVVLLGLEACFPSNPRGETVGVRLVTRHVPYFLVLGGYLVIRQGVVGSVLGGYSGMEELAASGRLADLLRQSWLEWFRLLYPDYSFAPPEWVPWLLVALLAAGALWSVARLRSGRMEARLYLWAVAWIFMWQLPYNAVQAVPANGRFWYLPAAGVGWLIAAAGALVPPRRRVLAVTAAAALLGGSYLWLLHRYVDLYAEAGRTAGRIRGEVLRLPEAAAPSRRVFLAACPPFVQGKFRVPVAQVFHWGLGDAFLPPFVEPGITVYPLPGLPPERLLPLLERPDIGGAWRWTGDTLRRMEAPGPAPSRRIETDAPASWDWPQRPEIRFPAIPGAAAYELIVLNQGHAVTRTAEPGGAFVEAELPVVFLLTMQKLYGGEIFWWVEARDPSGHPIAFSELRELPLMGPAR